MIKLDWRAPYVALTAVAANPLIGTIMAHAQAAISGSEDPLTAGTNVGQIAFTLIAGAACLGVGAHGLKNLFDANHRGRGVAELILDGGLIATCKVLYSKI